MKRNGYTFLTCLDLNNKCCAKDEAYADGMIMQGGGRLADLLIQRQQGCGIYCLCKNDKDVLPVNIISRVGNVVD